ncbi:MAG: alkaline phosphatase family protein [Anaerolineales bacterium]
MRFFRLLLPLLGIAILAYFWSNALMDSLYAYRSPLHANPPSPGEPLPRRLTARLVFVLIDGLRLDTSLDPQVMPFLNELRGQGASAVVHSRPPSYSDPGYGVLLIGAWPELHDGPVMNLPYEETPTWTQDNLFTAAHRAGLRTAVAGLNWFERLIPQSAVTLSFYTPREDRVADEQVFNAVMPWLKENSADFILVHFDQVDYAGHNEGGPRDARWKQAARRVDDLLRQLAATLNFEQDTLLVVSDHGHIERGGHGGDEAVTLIEPLVVVGAGVRPGHYGDVQQVDIAPTVAALLGISLPASTQGRVLTEMLTLTEQETRLIQALEWAQQERLLRAYLQAIGAPLRIPVFSGDPVAPFQQALEEARQARLFRERLPRAGLVLLFLLLLVRPLTRWGRSSPLLAGGALLYFVLFHLDYTLLQGRTYSLSSVSSAEDILTATARSTILAFGLAALFVFFRLRMRAWTRGDAAATLLHFTYLSLFLTVTPLLISFIWNGALITWTLPHFRTLFLGFLATIQSLLLAVLGPLFALLAASIARGSVFRAKETR